MNNFINNQRRRFRNAFSGLFTAAKIDINFKLQLLGGIFFLLFGFFMWPLSDLELLSLILAYVLIIITELQNTAFEAALDRVHPEQHDLIGKSKDIAAASVLVAGIFALIVMVMIVCNRLGAP